MEQCSCEALKAWVASTKGEYDEVLRPDIMFVMYAAAEWVLFAVTLSSQLHHNGNDEDNHNHCHDDDRYCYCCCHG